MATLKDIADYVGVSVSAVSLALRDHRTISLDTKQRIWAAQETLGYKAPRRRPQDRNGHTDLPVVEAKTRNIAFLLVDRQLDDAGGYGELFQNVTSLAYGRNWRVFLVTVSLESLQKGEIPKALQDSEIEGIIVAGNCDRAAHLHLMKLGVPLVKDGNYQMDDDPWMTCEPDFNVGLRLLVQRLAEFGHTRIGLLLGDTTSEFGQHIVEYYSREMAARRFVSTGIFCEMHTAGGSAKATRNLVRAGSTGIILGSGFFAPEVYAVCQDMNLAIPRDLSVVVLGKENSALMPRLAHVSAPNRSEAMVEKLEQLMIRPDRLPTRELFPMHFVPGGSLGDAPNSPVKSHRKPTTKKKTP